MITISLVNIGSIVNIVFFFLVSRSFKIYSLGNFQECNIILSTTVTMLNITSW